MPKEIELTNGLKTIVDDEDYEWASKFKWYGWKHDYTFYVKRAEWIKGGKGKIRSILLHREIVKPREGKQVDHVDRDGLNNMRSNLRECTQAENNRNKRSKYNKE